MRQVYGTKAHRAAGIEDLKPSATRTAVYGTVCTVVWEGGAARCPPTRCAPGMARGARAPFGRSGTRPMTWRCESSMGPGDGNH